MREAGLDAFEADGTMARHDAFEFERWRGGGVHAEFSGAGGGVTRFPHEFADGLIPIAIGIGEMTHGHAETVLQFFASGKDLLARLAKTDARQKRMRERMRADFVAGGKPIL